MTVESSNLVIMMLRNLAEIGFLILLGGLIVIQFRGLRVALRKVLYGGLFLVGGMLSMFAAHIFADGVYVDVRELLLAMAGLAGGIVSAVIALAGLGIVRLLWGGVGMMAGIGSMATAAAIGVVAGEWLRKRRLPENWLVYGGIGVSIAGTTLLWGFTIPGIAAIDIIQSYGIPLFVTNAVGAILFGIAVRRVRSSVTDERMESLQLDLVNAWERGEMYVCFQPQMETHTGMIRGFEALVRWNHPRLGPISPMEFIPIAEQTNHIHALGSWVLKRACEVYAQELRPLVPEAVVSVNVSSVQLTETFPELVRTTIEGCSLLAEQVELEITESVLIDSIDNAEKWLEELRAYGVHIALDDFGTGYSSLQYLDHLPLTQLKLDKAFIQRISETKQSYITESIIELAHKLGIRVTAEGVEEPEQLRKLEEWNCDIVQGYMFSKPLREPELRTFIQNHLQHHPVRRNQNEFEVVKRSAYVGKG